MGGSIRVDTTRLAAQFRRYREFSKRGLAEDVNTKSYHILQAASKFNKRGDKAAIEETFSPQATATATKVRITKSGVKRGREIVETRFPPNAYAITQAKRRKLGKAPLRGEELRAAVTKEFASRKKGIGFMASGWLAAIAKVARAIGKTVGKNAARREAQAIGDSQPARPGLNPTARWWNDAFSKTTTTDPPTTIAAEALQRAIEQEIRSMGDYIARKEQSRVDHAAR